MEAGGMAGGAGCKRPRSGVAAHSRTHSAGEAMTISLTVDILIGSKCYANDERWSMDGGWTNGAVHHAMATPFARIFFRRESRGLRGAPQLETGWIATSL
jgi:hypothetical protein